MQWFPYMQNRQSKRYARIMAPLTALVRSTIPFENMTQRDYGIIKHTYVLVTIVLEVF